MNNISGRKWARFTLALALIASVVGNVAHTVLAESQISLWLRIPSAVLWPIFTFLAIEIIVRMVWERRWTHNIARNILLVPAIPAAITSYEHLYSLLLMMGETRFIALIGPLAIDGMMIGCTMVLLFTRPELHTAAPSLDYMIDHYGIDVPEMPNWDRAAEIELGMQMLADAPVSPAPQHRERAARVSWDARKVAEMAVDGEKTQAIVDATGAGRATVDRFRRVARILRDNPRAEIDLAAERMRAEYVSMLRELASR